MLNNNNSSNSNGKDVNQQQQQSSANTHLPLINREKEVSYVKENNETGVGTATDEAHTGDELIDADVASNRLKPIEYKNGKKVENLMYNYENYYRHKEKIPKHYYPLVQYLENVEVKYHNDNLFEDSPCGFPTRAQ